MTTIRSTVAAARWPAFVICCALLGAGLAGMSDLLSRQRDQQLEREIASLPQPPDSWSFTVAGVTYICDRESPFIPARPAYRCTPDR
jgi:hypothetical protein